MEEILHELETIRIHIDTFGYGLLIYIAIVAAFILDNQHKIKKEIEKLKKQ